MFCLNIALASTSWRLLYRDGKKAREHWLFATAPDTEQSISLEDDFGQAFASRRDNIKGAMLEDLDKTKMGIVEMALHQQRTQNAAVAAAESDPGLRQQRRAGPAIIDPMNGFHPRQ